MQTFQKIPKPPTSEDAREWQRWFYRVCELLNTTGYGDLQGPLLGRNLESPASNIIQNNAEGAITFKTSARLADYVVINLQISHRWKIGSDIKPHIHWFQTSGAIPNFMIQYRWQRNGEAKTTAWASVKWQSNAFSYVSGVLNQITGFGAILPPEGYNISDILQIRLIRDYTNQSGLFTDGDGLVAGVDAVSFDCHYEVDGIGSVKEYTR